MFMKMLKSLGFAVAAVAALFAAVFTIAGVSWIIVQLGALVFDLNDGVQVGIFITLVLVILVTALKFFEDKIG